MWLLLLSAPIAARFMIAEEEGQGIAIAVGKQLPALTSPVLGIWLGIVVSLFVMPAGYIYLRAGPTRRQPWQVGEATPGSRIAIALGRFAANAGVMVAVLIALTIGGLILGRFIIDGPYQPFTITALAWLVALPTLLATAAIHVLFDARPRLRGTPGDVVFFILWLVVTLVAVIAAQAPSSFTVNLASLGGAVRPLIESAPSGSDSFAIGASELREGRIALDPMRGVMADGYIAARFAWCLIAVAVAAFAGLAYRPHKLLKGQPRLDRLSALASRSWLPATPPSPQRAGLSSLPILGMLRTELALVAGRGWIPILLIGIAILAASRPWMDLGGPASILLLIFALTAHAGALETKGLRPFAGTLPTSANMRRLATVTTGAHRHGRVVTGNRAANQRRAGDDRCRLGRSGQPRHSAAGSPLRLRHPASHRVADRVVWLDLCRLIPAPTRQYPVQPA